MKPTSPSYRRMYTKKGDSRKSSITKKDRTSINVDRHVLPYINKYAGEHFLYSEEAATKLIAIGVSKVYGFEPRVLPKPSIMSRAMRKVWGKNGVEAGIALRKPAKNPSVHAQPGSGDALSKPGRQG